MKIKIGIVDDSPNFREVMFRLLGECPEFEVVLAVPNGRLLQFELEEKKIIPDIILIGTDMQVMNGIETTVWLQQNQPSIKLIASPVHQKDRIIVHMLKAGCCSFIYKLSFDDEYKKPFLEVYTKGYFNPEAREKILWGAFQKNGEILLNDSELQFLELACSELSYEEILTEMKLTKRESNKYIDSLFKKFHVNGRNGLVLEALRRKAVAV